MSDFKQKNDEYWRNRLTPEQFSVCREKGTEAPFSGQYNDEVAEGAYLCACCGETLFASTAKFDSGCGWPSFDTPTNEVAIEESIDRSLGLARTEITCSNCGSHLGHVFEDGPTDTGLRYCVNSLSLDLIQEDKS